MRMGTMSGQDKPPTANEAAEVLRGLIAGLITRESAVRWASPWAFQKCDAVIDVRLLRCLENIAAADMISTDRPYLYGKEDFQAWLAEIQRD